MNFDEVKEVDELFSALVKNVHITDDVKRKLYFMQSDNELVYEIQAKYQSSEIFLTVNIAIILMNYFRKKSKVWSNNLNR